MRPYISITAIALFFLLCGHVYAAQNSPEPVPEELSRHLAIRRSVGKTSTEYINGGPAEHYFVALQRGLSLHLQDGDNAMLKEEQGFEQLGAAENSGIVIRAAILKCCADSGVMLLDDSYLQNFFLALKDAIIQTAIEKLLLRTSALVHVDAPFYKQFHTRSVLDESLQESPLYDLFVPYIKPGPEASALQHMLGKYRVFGTASQLQEFTQTADDLPMLRRLLGYATGQYISVENIGEAQAGQHILIRQDQLVAYRDTLQQHFEAHPDSTLVVDVATESIEDMSQDKFPEAIHSLAITNSSLNTTKIGDFVLFNCIHLRAVDIFWPL